MSEITIISRFSIPKSALVIAITAATLYVIYFLPLLHAGGPVVFIKEKPLWGIFLMFAWLAFPFAFKPVFTLIKQVLFRKRAGLWLEKGHLIYNSPKVWALDLSNVRDVSFGAIPIPGLGIKVHAIDFRLRDGKNKNLPTLLLAETPQELLLQIKSMLAAQ